LLLAGQSIFNIPVILLFILFLFFFLIVVLTSILTSLAKKSTGYELLEKKLGLHKGLGSCEVFYVDREPEGQGQI